MSDTVVDSSVVAKWVLPEPDSAQAHRVVTEVAQRGDSLVVLDLALIEVTNVFWKRFHQRLATLAETRQFLAELLRCPVRVEPALRLLNPALDIATRSDRAVCDALFVALADDLKAPGVTADEPLYRAVHGDFPPIVLLRNW